MVRAVECLLVGKDRLPRPLLDVGCGDGHFAATCLPGGADVGIDPSQQSTAEAARTGAYRMVARCSAASLPFGDESFAAVVSNCVIEHIPPLERALSEMSRVLRPGGRLVITVPSDRFADLLFWPRVLRAVGAERPAAAYARWFNHVSRHFHTYSREGWTRRLEQAGFQVEEWTGYLGADAMAVCDLSHYYGAPTLVSKRLTGRWILWPGKDAVLPWEHWLARLLVHFSAQIGIPEAAYLYFSAIKVRTPKVPLAHGT